MKEIVLEAAKKYDRADQIEFMGGIMGARMPYNADTYLEFISEAEQKGCTYCNVAFPRDTMQQDIKKFAEEILPSYK